MPRGKPRDHFSIRIATHLVAQLDKLASAPDSLYTRSGHIEQAISEYLQRHPASRRRRRREGDHDPSTESAEKGKDLPSHVARPKITDLEISTPLDMTDQINPPRS